MEYTTLGKSGLIVSRIALGCMSFGDRMTGWNSWVLDEEAAAPIFRQAVESGITFWDTANVYSDGASEEVVGRAISKYSRREDIVLATKVAGKMHNGPGGSGLSRKAILEQIDESLRRLGTDYVDLYQIHNVDVSVPFEETMEALHDIVKAGKVRYIGASNAAAWQLSKMQHLAETHGWTRFVSMQHHYNLLQREEEREMLPLLADQGLASIPWSPLARGRLTRPWGTETVRSQSDPLADRLFEEEDRAIVSNLQQVAEKLETPMAQVGIAWLLANPIIASPLIGATKVQHILDAVAALDVRLSKDDITALEGSYRAHEPTLRQTGQAPLQRKQTSV